MEGRAARAGDSDLFAFLRRRRREKIAAAPLPDAWRRILRRRVRYYTHLPPDDRSTLERHVQIFLAEKHFEGCGGFEMTDEARVTIAGFACLLILHEPDDYYPGLVSILVYPEAFATPIEEEGPDGVVALDPEERAGESWDRGAVILAWDEVLLSCADANDGYNVVLHEFAHQLDFHHRRPGFGGEFGSAPDVEEWSDVFAGAYTDLVKAVKGKRRTLIDEYGAENPAEFFAVATETFFEQPIALQHRHPELYNALEIFYRQDPAQLLRASRSAPTG